MKIIFESIEFKNIMSYGNNITHYDIKKGLTAFIGKNGQGKSVLLDSLCFCLFGEPYRNIRIKKLLNRKNKKGLYVACELVKNNTTRIKIERGLAPDVLNIYVNGDKLDLLSSKKLNQGEIDKILGINIVIFKQIISLSINQNKPFLTIPLANKRELIEQLFNINSIGDLFKKFKKIQSELKVSLEITSANYKTYSSNDIELTKTRDNLNNAKITFDNTKAEELATLNSKVNRLNKEKLAIETKIESLGTAPDVTKDDAEKLEIENNINKLTKQLYEYENNIKIANGVVSNLNKFDICPTCKNGLTLEYKTEELTKQKDIISSNSSKVTEINTEITGYRTKLTECNNMIKVGKDAARKLTDDLNTYKSDIRGIDREIGYVNDSIYKVNARQFEFDIEGFELNYTNNKKLLEDTQVAKLEIENKKVLNDLAIEAVSETGVKSFIFKKIIPVLNSTIIEYLKLFNIQISLVFDELMNEEISINGEVVDYDSFSEGEKKRIDMAILLSFIKITKHLADWNSNLLIIDELLDSSVDVEGLEAQLNSLKSLAMGSKQSVIIISHRNELFNSFDNIVRIKKNELGFSTLIEEI